MSVIDKSTTQTVYRSYSSTWPGGTESNGPLGSNLELVVRRSGSKKEGWSSIIASGGNATTDFDGREDVMISRSPYYVRTSRIDDPKTFSIESGDRVISFEPFPVNVDPELPMLRSKAASQAYSRIRSGFNAISFIGELVEVKKMLLNPANGLARGYTAYMKEAMYLRQRIRKLGDLRRAIASLYLEYNFGWVPLYMDIQSACDAYNDVMKQTKSMRVTGTAKQTYSASLRNSWNTGGYQTAAITEVDSVRVESSVQWKGAISFETPGSVSFNFGAGIGDFVPGIWNLLPWSFVVDYFANIGDILDADAIASQIRWKYALSTERLIARHSATREARPFSDFLKIDNFIPGGWTAECKTVRRRTETAISVPSLYFKVPSFKQGLNLVALFAAGRLASLTPNSTD